MNIQASETDFGVTLAKWGVPEGPYLVTAVVRLLDVRDIGRLPVDDSVFDPLHWYADSHDFRYSARIPPDSLYLMTLRSTGIEAEGLLEGVYDPYVFYRDAYRQRRIYEIYRGNPPIEAIQILQGTNDIDDADKLLKEQQDYENKTKTTKPSSPTGH